MDTDYLPTEEVSQFFTNFYAQSGNTLCFDCNEKAGEFVSVNNAISLCDKCAEIHREFPDNISLIKSSKAAQWLSSELLLLEHGGNAKLKKFFKAYHFAPDAAPIFKYKTLAAFYYRRKLRFESEGEEHPELPHDAEHLQQHENEGFLDSLFGGMSKVSRMITGIFKENQTAEEHHGEQVKEKEKEKETTEQAKQGEKSLAAKGIAAVKSGVSKAFTYLKEKTLGSFETHDESQLSGGSHPRKFSFPESQTDPEQIKNMASKLITKEIGALKEAAEYIKDNKVQDDKLEKEKVSEKEEIAQMTAEDKSNNSLDKLADNIKVEHTDRHKIGASTKSAEFPTGRRRSLLSKLAKEAKHEVQKNQPGLAYPERDDQSYPEDIHRHHREMGFVHDRKEGMSIGQIIKAKVMGTFEEPLSADDIHENTPEQQAILETMKEEPLEITKERLFEVTERIKEAELEHLPKPPKDFVLPVTPKDPFPHQLVEIESKELSREIH